MSDTSVVDGSRFGIDAARLPSSTEAEVLEAVRSIEVLRRQLDSLEHAVIAELVNRNVAGQRGYRSLAALLQDLLHIDGGEAGARVAAARDLGPRVSVTGEPLEPVFPHAAAAQAEGAISGGHARAVIRTVEQIPAALRAEQEEPVERRLVAAARTFTPRQLTQLGTRILAHLDPDGTLTDLVERDRRRYLRYHRRADGTCVGSFDTTAELGEHLDTLLTALSGPKAAADGIADPRTPGQRRHDALLDVCTAATRFQNLPTQAGLGITVILTGSVADYTAATGTLTTGTGAVLPTAQAKQWTGGSDTRLLAILADAAGRQVSYSTCQRLFTEQQRLVLVARDHGCSFPGCDAGPWLCQAHHILDWAKGGPTAVTNGTLLCRFHHREFELLGWACQYRNGKATWTPPAWLDPTQTPLVNTAHDPPDG